MSSTLMKMGDTVRRQIYLEGSQDEALKRRARGLGVSVSALAREYVECGLDALTEGERDRIWQLEVDRSVLG